MRTASMSFSRPEFVLVAVHGAIAIAVLLIDDALDGLAAFIAHVADCNELDIFETEEGLQIARAAITDAESGHGHAVTRSSGSAQAKRGGGDNHRKPGGRFQQPPSGNHCASCLHHAQYTWRITSP